MPVQLVCCMSKRYSYSLGGVCSAVCPRGVLRLENATVDIDQRADVAGAAANIPQKLLFGPGGNLIQMLAVGRLHLAVAPRIYVDAIACPKIAVKSGLRRTAAARSSAELLRCSNTDPDVTVDILAGFLSYL